MAATESEIQSLVSADAGLALRNAIQLWAEANTSRETYDRKDKLRDKIQVVTGFFIFAGKHPADVLPMDMLAWRESLEAQGQTQATVYARVSRVSALYKWLMANPQLGAYIPFNPAASARPRCPHPYQSDTVKDLTDDEMNALISLVRGQAERGSVVARRDYALLLLYFLTGMRRNEVISLRGSDVEFKDEGMVIKYRRKGGKYTKRAVEDPAARSALAAYLAAARRENVLGSERPLWTRHDRAGKPGAPLTSRAFAENLKT